VSVTSDRGHDIAAELGLEGLWAETLGDREVRIAVLDGPVDRAHPSLTGADLEELYPPASTGDEHGAAVRHGTHVASVIFGGHDGPVKGVAPGCRGLLVPIFRDGADGAIAPCSQLELAHAITTAIEAGADVVNVSGGQSSPSGVAHPVLADAVRAAAGRSLIVSAVGNEGCDCLNVPGALPSVLAVGAADARGLPLTSSNWGSAYRTQGILALGENVAVAESGGGLGRATGTSYATAIVAGVAALLLSVQRKRGRQPDPRAVRAALLSSAYACDPSLTADCRPFLVGLLDVAGAHARVAAASDTDGRPSPVARPTPQVGDIAPEFTLPDHTGRLVRLSGFRGKTVVLWFYPRADTPG
jgi:cyanobactin maturation PatA/PatG family protease